MKLKFYKIRPEAKLPVRAHRTDAGMDLFYCPDPNDRRVPIASDPRQGEYWISARESSLISTGLKTEVPEGYMLEIKNKSGIASKRKLVVGACVVDPGYDGEIYVNLHNIGVETQRIKPGDKIAQAVLVPVVHCGIEEVKEDNLNNGSSRGDGGFGSTGDR